MKITDCTKQEAGECADALRQLMRDAEVTDIDHEGEFKTFTGLSLLPVAKQMRLRDLLTALETAERRQDFPSPTDRVELPKLKVS